MKKSLLFTLLIVFSFQAFSEEAMGSSETNQETMRSQKQVCVQKIAEDGCNTCSFDFDEGDWMCSLVGCRGVEEPGKCLKYEQIQESEEQDQNRDETNSKEAMDSSSSEGSQGFCIQKIAEDGCNTCSFDFDEGDWMCTLVACKGVEEPGKCLQY